MVLRLVIVFLTTAVAVAGCTAHRSARTPVSSPKMAERTVGIRPTMLVAEQHAAPEYVHSASASAGTRYTLGSGDRVRITVFGQEDLSRTYPVDAGGYISMPLIGAVGAGGTTTFQLEERIAVALRQKYVKDPKVTVEVETHRPFFILGEVRNGGQFPYVSGMTVQTAVAIAGGYTARAKKRNVQLSRDVHGRTVIRTVPPSWKIQPGDTISVKERFF